MKKMSNPGFARITGSGKTMRTGITAFLAIGLVTLVSSCNMDRSAESQEPVSDQDYVTQTAASQAEISPEKAVALLKEGNARFTGQNMIERDLISQVEQTGSGQFPFAAVVSCIDSRIPTEMVFDQGVGDIFNARIAGNFVNTDILGSLEFAAKVAGSKAIVVLGHTQCGAVKGACDHVKLGNLTNTLANLEPALNAVTDVTGREIQRMPISYRKWPMPM